MKVPFQGRTTYYDTDLFCFLFLFHFSTTSTRTLEFSHHGSFIGFLHLSFSRDFFAMEADRVREIPCLCRLPMSRIAR
ncbi:hypothetical protein HanRHA438_Chr08g0357391 [Helianthus annuus]|uniref:Uncharacterized protein n=1 Tax=Helianthus annuus TaxID=4232 RepID=A0A9K3DEF1_HELAN|nr:hypothetical protein HanXRQr2_MTg0834791 [Helianthus annuus]KAJ0427224.1 hypothetical protein HanIR_MTg0916951 [Helianthus annuus]KAJ0427244.1 hypothetical protein HanIR_MTg0917271 [Helianthus annuus]KAJ0828931.1 hypothetical protein HanLR1_Chr00c0060g0701761 [Helianthus annuus]KAJ0898486.1 hypothetical protein HanRHA438_Chr08g0357391 [Helianthus annuus]